MNMTRTLTLILLVASHSVHAAEPEATIVCLPEPVTCSPPNTIDLLDPSFQRQLVEQQLKSQPPYWTTVYFYLPPLGDRELEELQIRYLEDLLARHKAKAEARHNKPVSED